MSQPPHSPSEVPPAIGQVGWPTAPPPRRGLGAGDPTEVGPYRLDAVLGEGGMGRVYLAHTLAGSAVAVKVVHREYAADPAFRKRFEFEVTTARRVQGLYTAPVIDADIQAGEPWLATAYIPGPSLQYAVTEHGPLSVEATLSLVAKVAEALQSIHAAGVIHRDLKPSNIILTAEGPKVIDFGIARAVDVTSITGTGIQPGTPAYMAPEYIDGKTVTPAADVFALGLVANFAVTGELAFGGGSAPIVIRRIVEQEPNLDGCPEPIRTITAACLSKDPRRRPTPAEVIQECRQTTDTPSPPWPQPATPTAGPVPGVSTTSAIHTKRHTGPPWPNTPPRSFPAPGPVALPPSVRAAFALSLVGAAMVVVDAVMRVLMAVGVGAGVGTTAGVVVGGVGTLAEAGVWTWIAVKFRAGRNWARITGTVLSIVAFASVFSTIGFFMSSSGKVTAVNVAAVLMDLVTVVIGLISVALLWSRSSATHFTRLPPYPGQASPYGAHIGQRPYDGQRY
ncbi:hypothetical protein GCM10023191_074240 [Actinoallomurus oryzae]|uniref:Protein kinase domain-containing protein n=2 Tax=Actinoallomurus oryzae TaxID=502180 RepID=A0ABP8QUU3_9ACTN